MWCFIRQRRRQRHPRASRGFPRLTTKQWLTRMRNVRGWRKCPSPNLPNLPNLRRPHPSPRKLSLHLRPSPLSPSNPLGSCPPAPASAPAARAEPEPDVEDYTGLSEEEIKRKRRRRRSARRRESGRSSRHRVRQSALDEAAEKAEKFRAPAPALQCRTHRLRRLMRRRARTGSGRRSRAKHGRTDYLPEKPAKPAPAPRQPKATKKVAKKIVTERSSRSARSRLRR